MLNFAIWVLSYSGRLNPEAEFHSPSPPLSLLFCCLHPLLCAYLSALYNPIIVNNQIKIKA